MSGICRICFEEAKFNIFIDELCFDHGDHGDEVKKLKIYIVLNDFLYEKLYEQDSHSAFLCDICCSSLCDSFAFMTKVRSSEKNQKLGLQKGNEAKSLKRSRPQDEVEDVEPLIEVEDAELEVEDIAVIGVKNEEEEENPLVESLDFEEFMEDEHEQEKLTPKSSKSSFVGIPEAITFTHYELEQYKENDRNVISLNVYPLMLASSEGYDFDISFISHSDSSFIYKCKHCIKAFSNAEFLLKHTISSHLCLICMYVSSNYKDLNTHLKKHKTVTCHFCNKTCSSPSSFRQHLRKVHDFNLPAHVGIISDEHLK